MSRSPGCLARFNFDPERYDGRAFRTFAHDLSTGIITDLGTLPSGHSATAYGINALGDTVGYGHTFVGGSDREGTMVDRSVIVRASVTPPTVDPETPGTTPTTLPGDVGPGTGNTGERTAHLHRLTNALPAFRSCRSLPPNRNRG